MSTEESRKTIYRECRKSTGINKRQWARLFSLGELKGAAEVDKKEKTVSEPDSRGVNMPEALAAGLLKYLHNLGKDIEKIEFDEKGNIVNIPSK